MPDFLGCALHHDALVLAICIAKFANIYTQTAFPSNRTLMGETGFNRARLQRAKQIATNIGALSIEARYDEAGDLTSNEYTLNPKFVKIGADSEGVAIKNEITAIGLTAKELLLLVTLARFAGKNRVANPTNKAICEAMGCCQNSVRTLKKGLIEKGLIEDQQNGTPEKGQTANKITVLADCICVENRTHPLPKIVPTPPQKETTPPPSKNHTHPPTKNRTPNKEKKRIVNKEEEMTNEKKFSMQNQDGILPAIQTKKEKEKKKVGAALNCKANKEINPCDRLHGQNIGIGELLSDNQYNALISLHAPAIVRELQISGVLSITAEELIKVAVTRVIAFVESKAIDVSKCGHFAQTLNWGITAAKEQFLKTTKTNNATTYKPTAQTIANIAAYCNYIANAGRQH